MENEEIVKLAEAISKLDGRRQKMLAERFFAQLNEKELFNWFALLGGLISPRSRWIEIEQWMECRFEKNIDWTPRKMALICKNYLNMNPRMFPFLIKTAQRVKQRIAMRRRSRKNAPEKKKLSTLDDSAKHCTPDEEVQ